MTELIWFHGSIEEKPEGPDPEEVSQLWKAGVPALAIATRLDCTFESVAAMLEELQSRED